MVHIATFNLINSSNCGDRFIAQTLNPALKAYKEHEPGTKIKVFYSKDYFGNAIYDGISTEISYPIFETGGLISLAIGITIHLYCKKHSEWQGYKTMHRFEIQVK